MHRILNQLNILLSKNKHVLITDFETSQTKGIGSFLFMAPELYDDDDDNDNDDDSKEKGDDKYTNKVDVCSFGIILIFIVTNKYQPRSIITCIIPNLSNDIAEWVRELITKCLSREAENRPSFSEIIEIMKANNYDLFSDSKDQILTKEQRKNKEYIEKRILSIEAFEYQMQ